MCAACSQHVIAKIVRVQWVQHERVLKGERHTGVTCPLSSLIAPISSLFFPHSKCIVFSKYGKLRSDLIADAQKKKKK